MTNNFLDFVDDAHFLKAVEYVQVATKAASEQFSLKYTVGQFTESAIDPFKMLFDLYDIRDSKETWITAEIERQLDKTLNNKIGEFHQMLLGGVKGWSDLGVGHDSEVDLAKDDLSVFIELKNKYNTMNSSATEKCRDKLMAILETHSSAKAYWCYIVPSSPTSGESQWTYDRGKKLYHRNLYKAWGDKVYEIVTGRSGNLIKTWKALNSILEQKDAYQAIKVDRNKIVKKCTERVIAELGDNNTLEYFYKITFG